MKYIFLLGFKGSGKDTFGNFLNEEFNRLSYQSKVTSFASALRENIYNILPNFVDRSVLESNKEEPIWNIDDRYRMFYDKNLEDEYVKTHNMLSPAYGSLRYFLNTVGENMKKIYGPNVWVNKMFLDMKGNQNVSHWIITDLRHEVEIEYIKKNIIGIEDCLFLYIVNDKKVPDLVKEYNPKTKVDIEFLQNTFGFPIHESMWIPFKYYVLNKGLLKLVFNNGSLEELKEQARKIRDLILYEP